MDRLPTGATEPSVAQERLEIRSGKTLQLVTVSVNLHLRGTEVADPELEAVKSLLRRAGEVIGRVEDTIVFYGLGAGDRLPLTNGGPIVRPLIYSISGGRDFIGLLQAPMAHQQAVQRRAEHLDGTPNADLLVDDDPERDVMCVSVAKVEKKNEVTQPAALIEAVIVAVQKLERHGHFGPFAAVLGHELFKLATTPTNPSLVLPTDRIMPFLEGGPLLRSGTLNDSDGLVVALGGSPVELVLGTDIDIDYLQRTLEARHVIRVYERFVVRIKELDVVCRITSDRGCDDLYAELFEADTAVE